MVKTLETDALPDDFPGEFTFRQLNDWYERICSHGLQPRYIGMTLKQEMWYRFLLNPDQQGPAIVTFRGIPILVLE